MAAPWKGADAVEWPDDEDEALEEAPAEIEGDFVLPVAADDVVRSDDEEDHLDVDLARVGLDFDELDELDNNHEFQQFLTEQAQEEGVDENKTSSRLMDLYDGLEGLDSRDRDGFEHFVDKALFNIDVCPLCKKEYTGELTTHLEQCPSRTTPITDDNIPTNPTAIIVYIQEQTSALKHDLSEQADTINKRNAELEALQKKCADADAGKEKEAARVQELEEAKAVLEETVKELDQRLEAVSKELAEARKQLTEAIESHKRQIRSLERADETEAVVVDRENKAKLEKLQKELNELKKARAEVEEQLVQRDQYVKDNLEAATECAKALEEITQELSGCQEDLDKQKIEIERLKQERVQLESDREAATRAFALMSAHMRDLLTKLASEVTPSALADAKTKDTRTKLMPPPDL